MATRSRVLVALAIACAVALPVVAWSIVGDQGSDEPSAGDASSLQECLREHGVRLPDSIPPGGVIPSGTAAPPGAVVPSGPPVPDEEFRKALEECGGQNFPGGLPGEARPSP
jgi:hypothetical protein